MCIYKHILNTWHSISQVGWFFHQSSGMPFGPGRWLHNRIGGSSQHSDQNPAKILIPSIYGMSTVYLHLRLMFMVNVGKYTIHGCCGYMWIRWILQILILEAWHALTTNLEEYAHCKCRLSMQDILYTHTKDIERQCSLCKNTFSPFIAMNAGWWPNFAGMACAGHFPCCRLHQLGGTSWILWECPGSMKSNYLT